MLRISKFFFLLLICSCAYSFNQSVFEKYSKIYIPLSENSTTHVGLTDKLMESLKLRLSSLNTVILNNHKNADMIIYSNVVDYVEKPLTYEEDFISSYQITIVVDFKAVLSSGKVLFSNKVNGIGVYKFNESDEIAIEAAIKNVTSQFVSEIDNQW